MPSLTIKGQQFNIDDDPALVVGAQMTEGHIASLQQTRRENIRNNFAAKVEKAAEEGEITSEKLAALQADLNEYAGKYQFGVRSAGPRRVVDPVEREMLKLAKEDIAAAFYAKHGERLKGEQLSEAAEKLLEAKGEDYNRRARRALRDREAAAESVLTGMAA